MKFSHPRDSGRDEKEEKFFTLACSARTLRLVQRDCRRWVLYSLRRRASMAARTSIRIKAIVPRPWCGRRSAIPDDPRPAPGLGADQITKWLGVSGKYAIDRCLVFRRYRRKYRDGSRKFGPAIILPMAVNCRSRNSSMIMWPLAQTNGKEGAFHLTRQGAFQSLARASKTHHPQLILGIVRGQKNGKPWM